MDLLFFFGINLQGAPLYVKYPAFLIFIIVNNLIVFAYTWRKAKKKFTSRA